ncbi:MAG: DUF934 domain-containing protein [Nitratireductor sp.]
MNDQASASNCRLWTPDGFRDDFWRHSDSAEALAGNDSVILPLAAWLALDATTRRAESGRIGVALAPGDDIAAIVGELADIPLVALAFPGFADGRSYSKAALLRERHGYRGRLRATGQVLIDQIALMLRTGFDEFEVSHATTLARLEAGRVGGLPVHYQPAAKGAPAAGGYAWRRLPTAS